MSVETLPRLSARPTRDSAVEMETKDDDSSLNLSPFLLTVLSFPTAEASAVRMISSGQFLAQDGQLERPVGMKPYILSSHSPAALSASIRQPWRVPKSGQQERRMPLGQPSYFFPLGRHLAFSRSCFVDVTRPVIVGVSSRSNMVNLFQWQTSVARG